MKKLLSLLLVAMMMFALVAGCSDDAKQSPSASATPSASTNVSDGSGNGEGDENIVTVVDGDTTYTHSYTPIEWEQYPATDVGQDFLQFDMVAVTKDLPLVDEKVTFDAWWPMGASDYLTGYNDAANIQELENRTNIHIDYFHPSSSEAATSFPLMIASNDYSDMIYYAGYYTGGGDKAIEDEVYIRLNELIDQYAPNYKTIREYSEEARKMTITSSGNIWGFYNICSESMPGYMGLNIRQDFMDRAGIAERPVTIDDWDETLGIMLDAIDEAEYAFALPPTGVARWSAFLSAWGIGGEWFQVDGVAKYGPVEPEFRNYVELMRDWYQKGYLRTDFYAVAEANYTMDITWEEYGSGKCVAADGSNTFGNMLSSYTDNPDIFCVAVRQPVLNEGDETHIRFDQGYINGEQLAITTECENPELLVQWMDYRYTLDGYLLLNHGVEGLTYVRDGEWHVSITDNIINNEEGVSASSYKGKYCAGGLTPSLCDYTINWCFLDPAYTTEIQVWGQDKCDHNYPDIDLLTAADGAEFAALFTDIETYVFETVPKFIIGTLSMDNYDDFVNQIKAMDIDRCIELKQIALDDFNSR